MSETVATTEVVINNDVSDLQTDHNFIDQNSSSSEVLIDFGHEREPDISISANPSNKASISEVWGPYPFKPKCQRIWDSQVSDIANKIALVNPYIQHKNPGEEIAAIDAVNWVNGQFGQVDFRPKLYDNITKSHILCDTGADQLCAKTKGGYFRP